MSNPLQGESRGKEEKESLVSDRAPSVSGQRLCQDERRRKRQVRKTRVESLHHLHSLKARLSGSEKPAPWDTVDDAGDGQCEVVSSEEEDYQPSPEKLDTGTEIIPFHNAGKEKKKESKSFNAVATRGTTMKGLQGQLANRALAAMDQHRSKKKEKKSPAEKVGEAIVKALGVGKVKKEKKGKKRKSKKEDKKKKRKKSGGDPSSSGDSSDSGESSGGSSMDQDSGSSEEYENPMRKKSRDRPGAVLEMFSMRRSSWNNRPLSPSPNKSPEWIRESSCYPTSSSEGSVPDSLGAGSTPQRELECRRGAS